MQKFAFGTKLKWSNCLTVFILHFTYIPDFKYVTWPNASRAYLFTIRGRRVITLATRLYFIALFCQWKVKIYKNKPYLQQVFQKERPNAEAYLGPSQTSRSTLSRCSMEKSNIFIISRNSQENNCVGVSF